MPPTTDPAIARGGEGGGDPASSASEILVPPDRRRRRLLLFGGVGIAGYLLALLATIPARLVLPDDMTGIGVVSGTVWHGEAALTGGNRIAWRWAPLRSLTSLSFAANVVLAGPRTDIIGRLRVSRRAVMLDSVVGQADGAVLRAVFPSLPFTCDLPLRLDLPQIAITPAAPDIRGDIRSAGGMCRPAAGGVASPLPPLIATARPAGRAGSIVTVTPLTQRRRILARLFFAPDGRVSITVPPAGAALLPFAGPPGGLSIAMTL